MHDSVNGKLCLICRKFFFEYLCDGAGDMSINEKCLMVRNKGLNRWWWQKGKLIAVAINICIRLSRRISKTGNSNI